MMKKLFFSLISLVYFCATQTLGQNGISHLIELYVDEQYEVIASKLDNEGFKIVKSTPDYELNGVKYKGDFRLEKIDYFPNYHLKSLGLTTEVYWDFQTIDESSHREIRIKFEIVGSSIIFDAWFRYLEAKYGSPKDCLGVSSSESLIKCGEFYVSEMEGKGAEPGSVITIGSPIFIYTRYNEYDYSFDKKANGFILEKIKGNLRVTIMKYPLSISKEEYFESLSMGDDFLSIPIKHKNGVYYVPVMIGSKEFLYIVDSGASDITIQKSTENFLKEIGAIRTSDYLPSRTYSLADGSTIEYRRVNLSVVKIGNTIIENVTASIVDDDSPLLLGQSLLKKFSNWRINNDSMTIEFVR